MSQVRSDVDLSALARGEELAAPRRRWLRVVLPLAILLAFGAILLASLGELFATRVEVAVVRPRAVQGAEAASVRAGRVAVQAAGWLEPDPFLIHVAALTPGVLQEVHVQESDVVQAGDVLASLVPDDARIARDAAAAALAQARADRASAEARARIADERFDAALEVTEALAVAVAVLDGKHAEAAHRAAAVEQGEARLELARDELVVQQALEAEGASGPRQVEIATARVREERGGLAVLEADAALAAAEAEQAEAALARARADVELRFADRLERDLAAAAVERTAADVARAAADLAAAELALERCSVRAPVGGVVLERLTVPGMVLAVQTQGHAVCSLYDPAALRVRVDVPLADVEKLFVGQRAEVAVGSRPGRPYAGEVIRVAQLADIQKVTLEAQVRIEDGDALLRPDMLAQVRFLGGAAAPPESADLPAVLLVPAELVRGDALWVLDASGTRAEQRRVELGNARGGDVEVLAGLNLTDKLIDTGGAPLVDGARVRVRGGE